MDQFVTIFSHISQCRIIVCKECRIGVMPASMNGHLDAKHTYLTAETRKDIVLAARRIEGLAEKEEDIVYPDSTSDPLPYLTVWKDGFKCVAEARDGTPCGHIRRRLED